MNVNRNNGANCAAGKPLNLNLGTVEKQENLTSSFLVDPDSHNILMAGQGSDVNGARVFDFPKIRSAKIRSLQISVGADDVQHLETAKLIVERKIGNISKSKSVDLAQFNTMDAFQTGKITINGAALDLTVADALYLDMDAGEGGANANISVSFDFTL